VRDVIILVVSGITGGGIFTAIASLITGRAIARKTNVEGEVLVAKLPAEVDSVVVQGAEQAVLTMRSALESATLRITELEEDRADDRRRIAELENKVRELEAKVRRAEEALTEARDAGASLRRELAEFSRDRDHRRQ
jgi:septal ring factor EnvC (AmiA/AmiB activator)